MISVFRRSQKYITNATAAGILVGGKPDSVWRKPKNMCTVVRDAIMHYAHPLR